MTHLNAVVTGRFVALCQPFDPAQLEALLSASVRLVESLRATPAIDPGRFHPVSCVEAQASAVDSVDRQSEALRLPS